jgi:drug/metabolite transporter superfamily protein YnfA
MSSLRRLDDRVLRNRGTPARDVWFRQHGWWVYVLLGLALLAFAGWGFAQGRPALAGAPTATAGGMFAVAAYLLVTRDKRR